MSKDGSGESSAASISVQAAGSPSTWSAPEASSEPSSEGANADCMKVARSAVRVASSAAVSCSTPLR